MVSSPRHNYHDQKYYGLTEIDLRFSIQIVIFMTRSRYEGGGIYRHTWLTTVPLVHIAPNGVFAPADVLGDIVPRLHTGSGRGGVHFTSSGGAIVRAQTTIVNLLAVVSTVVVSSAAIDVEDNIMAAASLNVTIPARQNRTVTQTINVTRPWLWSPDSPTLYTLTTSVDPGNAGVRDTLNTTFGIRRLRFDAQHGFFMNDQHLKVKGLCNHQVHSCISHYNLQSE